MTSGKANSSRPASPQATRGSTWFFGAWDVLFVVLVAVGTVRAFVLDRPPTYAWIVTSLAAATAVWYVVPLVLHRSAGPRERTAGWLAGVAIGAVTLSVLASDFAWLAFPLAFQLGYRLRPTAAAWVGAALALAAIAGLARDGQLRLAEVIGPTVGITMAVVVAIGYRTVRDQRDHNRRLVDELAATRERLGEEERARGVAEERARLSREIHDTLAQGLASSVLHVQAVAQGLDRASDARQQLVEVEQQLRQGLEEARRFVRDLAPAELDDTPLTESLRRLCHHHKQVAGPTITFDVSGEPQPLPTDHEIVLYRVAQEALTNVRKHASAEHVRVTLTFLGAAAVLDVVDDGEGFDPNAADAGHGLRGMRARLEGIHGHFDLETESGRGTALAATVPLPVESDDDGR